MLMNSDTARRSTIKDQNDNYLWVPGLVNDQPDKLRGVPVAIDENMPSVSAGAL